MSAIVCGRGKRSFFEESDSPLQSIPLKRLRPSLPHQRIHVQLSSQGGDATGENASAGNLPAHGSEWVELLIREMTNASHVDDARARAASVLEVLQKSILDRAGAEAAERQQESMIWKQLEALTGDNTLLKRAVVIQHKRQKEYDEQQQQLQHLKQIVVQREEQVNALMVDNYKLRKELEQALQSSRMPGHFPPYVF